MFTKAFAKDALERAVKAFGSAGASLLVAGSADVFNVDWANFFGVAGGAAVASLLLSLASLKAGQTGTASVVPEVGYTAGAERVL